MPTNEALTPVQSGTPSSADIPPSIMVKVPAKGPEKISVAVNYPVVYDQFMKNADCDLSRYIRNRKQYKAELTAVRNVLVSLSVAAGCCDNERFLDFRKRLCDMATEIAQADDRNQRDGDLEDNIQ